MRSTIVCIVTFDKRFWAHTGCKLCSDVEQLSAKPGFSWSLQFEVLHGAGITTDTIVLLKRVDHQAIDLQL